MYNGYDTAKEYLVQTPNENADDFKVRVELATYNNIFERIITSQVGQVYRKQIIFDDVPEAYIDWLEDIKFEQRLADATTRADIDGKGLLMIDMPVDGGDPYLISIKRESLLNWRIENGVFTMAVILEYYEEREDFEIKYLPQYRVLKEDGNIDIWREINGAFAVFDTITTSYDFIPLYLFDFGDVPPMYNIAVMSKNMFNCSTMTDNAIRKATDPSLLTVGLGLDSNSNLKLGVNATINTDNPEARVEWIELNGASIPIAKEDLRDQLRAIAERALQLDQVGVDQNKTATQVNRENAESNARLSDMSSIMEYGANDVYAGLVRMKYNTEATGKIVFARDFKDEGIANQFVSQMTQLWVAGAIPHKILLETLVEKEQLVIDDIDEAIRMANEEGVPNEEITDDQPFNKPASK